MFFIRLKNWFICISFVLLGALTCTFVTPLKWFWFLPLGMMIYFNMLTQSLPIGENLKNNTKSRALFFGFGYYLFLFHWLANPLFIAGIEKYYLLLPIAILFIPILLGLHFLLPAYIMPFTQKPWQQYIFIAVILSVLEYIRLIIMPFYPMSFVLLNSFWFAQSFYYFSPLLLSCGLFFIFAFMAYRIRNKSWIYYFLNAGIFSAVLMIGNTFQTKLEVEGTQKVVIIQPNVPQIMKNDISQMQSKIDRMYELTIFHSKQYPNALILWPEASIPAMTDYKFFTSYNIDISIQEKFASSGLKLAQGLSIMKVDYSNQPAYRVIKDARMLVGLDAIFIKNLYLGDFSGALLMGINTFDLNEMQMYTSTALFSKNNKSPIDILKIYDKITLIPFGEYIPLRSLLPNWPFLKAMAATIGDYKAGMKSTIHYWQGKTFAVLICYEGLFDIPHTQADCIKKKDREKLDAIIHISNDAWFGNSFCLYQDLDHSRVNAIKYNTKVLRCLNTGISAEIDRYGRVLKDTEIEKEEVLIASL